MDFSVTAEQREFQASVRALAADVAADVVADGVAPGAADRDRDGRFDLEVWAALGRAGLLGLPIPQEYGGAGGSIIDCCLGNEALAEGGRAAGLNLSLGAHWVIGTAPIWLHGSDEQRRRWLPGLCSGGVIGAWAIHRAGGGQRRGRTAHHRRARRRRLAPQRIEDFVTNGPVAGLCSVLARTGERGATAFVVDTDTPGFAVGRELDKLGCRASPTSEIVRTDCRVGEDRVLGPVGEALWRIAFECFDWERTVMMAASIGGMQATLDDELRYARDRRQFGRPIAQFQEIAHKLADRKINLEVCRTAVYRAAYLKQVGAPHQMEASIGKALVGRLSVDNALEPIQIRGGYGYLRDFPAERALRDAKLASIGAGTTQIQKTIISRLLLGEDAARGAG